MTSAGLGGRFGLANAARTTVSNNQGSWFLCLLCIWKHPYSYHVRYEKAMTATATISAERLNSRRTSLGMSCRVVAERSGVSEPTVKRILGGHIAEASFANVVAIAQALGASLGVEEVDPDELCRQQARRKAQQIARLVQGTSALESQAVDGATYSQLLERSYHQLMAGSRRRLWSE